MTTYSLNYTISSALSSQYKIVSILSGKQEKIDDDHKLNAGLISGESFTNLNAAINHISGAVNTKQPLINSTNTVNARFITGSNFSSNLNAAIGNIFSMVDGKQPLINSINKLDATLISGSSFSPNLNVAIGNISNAVNGKQPLIDDNNMVDAKYIFGSSFTNLDDAIEYISGVIDTGSTTPIRINDIEGLQDALNSKHPLINEDNQLNAVLISGGNFTNLDDAIEYISGAVDGKHPQINSTAKLDATLISGSSFSPNLNVAIGQISGAVDLKQPLINSINTVDAIYITGSSFSSNLNEAIGQISAAVSNAGGGVTYTQITATSVNLTMLSSNYYRATNKLTYLSANINQNNSCLRFSTGPTFTSAFDIGSNFYINQQFNFEPNSHYIIAVDDYTVVWQEIESGYVNQNA